MKGSFPPRVKSNLPRTVAEETRFHSTSLYPDVIRFIEAMQKVDPDLRVENFATSVEGRPLPLVIVGPRGVVDPKTARESGKPVIFIMGNIHAGEVEGKEAALMLLRDLVAGKLRGLRDKMVILIAPIYNADGNEKLTLTNRPTQMGPPGGSGTRENAQGLDLNRDYLKLESPEANGLVRNILERWDPLLTVDLHTTNGSYHGFSLTYAPTLNPNAPAEIIEFEREHLLPRIQETMRDTYDQKTYYYGNFVDQLTPEKGWYTFDHRPRFGNNYCGLRNRFVILSEAYSYIDFRARIEVTYQFLWSILGAVKKYAKDMVKIAARTDEEAWEGNVKELGIRFDIAPWKEDVEILWERSVADPAGAPDPETGKGSIRPTGEVVAMRMTDYGVFVVKETEPVPAMYVVDGDLNHIAKNLLQHGIVVERLNETSNVVASEFVVSAARRSDTPFQGHRELTLDGTWRDQDVTLTAGTFVIRTNQPLVRVLFYLLEPRSDDGLVNWNLLDSHSEGPESLVGKPLPIRKIMKPVPLAATVVRDL